MIVELVLDAEATEPAISQVELDLAAQRAFRADGEHVTDDKHPYHQHRINRGAAGVGIVRRQLGPNPRQIENTRNGPNLVIVRHHLFKIERIEQLPLILAAPPHHYTPPPMIASAQRNHCSTATSNDFCNKMSAKRTCWSQCRAKTFWSDPERR